MNRCLLCVVVLSISAHGQASANKGPQKITHSCHVYAVDIARAEKATDDILSGPVTPQEMVKRLKSVELILGTFTAEIGEEVRTTKSFPFPGSPLVVTASVFYTDETMRGGDSMWQGLAIGKAAVEDAITAPGASVTEVSFDQYTFKVRTKQTVCVDGKLWGFGNGMPDDVG